MSYKHKFDSSDMPEIRRVRSSLLISLKLVKKCKRLDKITKAILPDIDWNRLSVHSSMADESTNASIDKLNTALSEFRDSMSEQLEHIMCSLSTTIQDRARAAASSPDLFQSAATMAQKYHDRGNKSANHARFSKTKQSRPSPAATKPTSPSPKPQQRTQSPVTKPSPKVSQSAPAPVETTTETQLPRQQQSKSPASNPVSNVTQNQRPPFKSAKRVLQSNNRPTTRRISSSQPVKSASKAALSKPPSSSQPPPNYFDDWYSTHYGTDNWTT